MSDKKFTDMTPEEKMKELHAALEKVRSSAEEALAGMRSRMNKLEERISKLEHKPL